MPNAPVAPAPVLPSGPPAQDRIAIEGFENLYQMASSQFAQAADTVVAAPATASTSRMARLITEVLLCSIPP